MGLEIDQLAARRAGRAVLGGLHLAVPQGQVAELRGPNGVGKSTLLRVLAGFVPLAAGDARLDGVSLARQPGAFRDRVAYAGHLDAVKPALSFRANLALWAGLYGSAGVEAALARFGLATMADRPLAQGSAGQRRRLGLARLMVIDRPLWLLDEPTVSLDAAGAATVADLVAEHLARGGLALIATHIPLGVPAEVVTLAPPTARDSADPFLAGAW